MALHIGIVACSAEGAALCYRTICAEAPLTMGKHNHPELSMHTHALAHYVARFAERDWKGVADLMVSSADKLAAAGAELLVSPDNTIHCVYDEVVARTSRPWLNIADEVVAEAQRRGFKRLAVMGTRLLMEGDVYAKAIAKAGLEMRLPSTLDRGRIDAIIFDELNCGELRSESLMALRLMIERLRAEGCDAVVLGCTELPLLVTPESSPLPTLDSTRILARAALRRATDETTI